MKILALIPARMGSSRFPGKPMAKILNKPMIGHVYDAVSRCKSLTFTAVATCDNEIYEYIYSLDGEAVMTLDTHERASDRCAEALLKIEKERNLKFDIVVMIQGDEPMTHPDMIDEAIKPMIQDQSIKVVNLVSDISTQEEFYDRNCIKVVTDLNNNALYFSREPIPSSHNMDDQIKCKKQVCIIPFRRDYLIEYTNLAPTNLEIQESVDMLRVLEHGENVKMVPTKHKTHAVDTRDDLIKVEKIMKSL